MEGRLDVRASEGREIWNRSFDQWCWRSVQWREDFALFASLPWVAWRVAWTRLLVAVLVAEIVLTLWDFAVEVVVRRDLGDVYAGRTRSWASSTGP